MSAFATPTSARIPTCLVTVALKAVSCGTDQHVVQEGLPDVMPLEHCYLDWQESLMLLGKLVEAAVAARDAPRTPSLERAASSRCLDRQVIASSVWARMRL